MIFRDEMNQIARYYNKNTYEQLKDEIRLKAENGEFSMIKYESDVVHNDIVKLRDDDKLDVEFIKGQDYNYWKIRW